MEIPACDLSWLMHLRQHKATLPTPATREDRQSKAEKETDRPTATQRAGETQQVIFSRLYFSKTHEARLTLNSWSRISGDYKKRNTGTSWEVTQQVTGGHRGGHLPTLYAGLEGDMVLSVEKFESYWIGNSKEEKDFFEDRTDSDEEWTGKEAEFIHTGRIYSLGRARPEKKKRQAFVL